MDTTEPSGDDRGSGGRLLLTEGILVATTPVVAYAIAFQIERGHAGHFDYPTSLIRLDFAQVLVTWLRLISGAASLLLTAFALAMLVPARPAKILFKACWRLVLLASLVALLISERAHLGGMAFVLAGLAGIGAVVEVLAAVVLPARNRTEATFLDRIAGAADERWDREHTERSLPYESLFDRARQSATGRSALAVLYIAAVALVFALGIPQAFGSYQARRTRDLPVLPGQPEFLVVRRYGPTFVAMELDSAGAAVLPRVRLVPDGNVVTFAMRHFDRLVVTRLHDAAMQPTQPVSPSVKTTDSLRPDSVPVRPAPVPLTPPRP